jgi:uncharacterized repeat protein (TIGR01451 family)
MTRRRHLVLGLGIVLGVAGVTLTVIPDLSVDIRVTSVDIALIALLTLGLTLYLIKERLQGNHQRIDLPTPEHRHHAVPGAEIDSQITALSMINRSTDTTLRSRLEQAALSVLAQETLDEEQVREQLSEESWTDDPHAAAFFSASRSRQPSAREHLRTLRTGEPTSQRRIRHAIAALSATLADSSGHHRDGGDESIAVQSLPTEEPTAKPTDETDEPLLDAPTERRTDRWQGVTALALAVGAGGMLLRQPALLLASVIGVGLAAYSRAAIPPSVVLEIERTVSETQPAIGDEVHVTVTIRNVGDTLLPDCSVIDGVPSRLVVTDGSPRHGTALRPGKATTMSYTLSAVRGEHVFTSPLVIARDFSGCVEHLTHVEPTSATTITCVPRLEPLETVQLRPQATRFGGRVTTETGGNGVEFHTVRDYQPSDPRSRINWNQLAKTGELSTLQFREERVATVVLVIDARTEAVLAPDSDGRSAVDRSVTAAGRIFATFQDTRTSVGIAALSAHPGTCWLAPGTGDAHRKQARQLLATHPALSPSRSTNDMADDQTTAVEHLRHRLPSDAQLIVLTPLCDDAISDSIRQLAALGYAPTVISPDPTVLTTPGRQLAHIERDRRMTALRSGGISVVNWGRGDDDSLSAVLTRLRVRGQPAIARTSTPWRQSS